MVNKNLFSSPKNVVPVADSVNDAGGVSYLLSDKQALAQIACTGTFNGSYYNSEEDVLKLVKDAVEKVKGDPQFIAKTAIYARRHGFMKDIPAYLTAYLSTLDNELFKQVFPQVIDNGKMLRNAIQIGRSGQLGKVKNMSAGSWRKATQAWFDEKTPEYIFGASIGNDPKLADIIKMCRPKPNSEAKKNLFGYLLGKDHKVGKLPKLVRDYEKFKVGKAAMPKVDFRMLDSLPLTLENWTEIALNASWTSLRMNLNTFQRHGVLANPNVVKQLAERLANREAILAAKCFPYQLFLAYLNATEVPSVLREALQDAMEVATENVPEFSGTGYIAVDTSGSMSSPATGNRGSATSKARCIDVAALFGSCILRKNPHATLLPFDTRLYMGGLNPRDSVISNAEKLAKYGGGGTNCSLPVQYLVQNSLKADWIVFVSDNESWVDRGYNGTGLMSNWLELKKNNKNCKLVCLDLHATNNSQVKSHKDILQIGGFSDNVFTVVSKFIKDDDASNLIREIEAIEI